MKKQIVQLLQIHSAMLFVHRIQIMFNAVSLASSPSSGKFMYRYCKIGNFLYQEPKRLFLYINNQIFTIKIKDMNTS